MLSRKRLKQISLFFLASTILFIFFFLNFNFYFSDFLVRNFAYKSDFMSETSILKDKIRSLETQIGVHKEIVKENEELRNLLKLKESEKYRLISSEVIIKSPFTFNSVGILNKGSDYGIVKDSIVISTTNVVGIISKVFKTYSEFNFTHSPKFNLIVFIGPDKVAGIMKGNGISSYIKFVPLESNIKVGDSIFTANNIEGSLSYKVGVVDKVETSQGFLTIKVKSNSNPRSVKFVSIIKNE